MVRKGDFGDNWWAKRWNTFLNSYGWQNRLVRGKSYARKGRVLSLDISPGSVAAKVEGSRSRPYSVKIKFEKLTKKDWKAVFSLMAARASYSALLLAGEMPQNIEDVFQEASVSLFPLEGDIAMRCSCPDWALPCKHIAAVFYVLGERFDEDPFLLFQLRGRGREMVIKELREQRSLLAGENCVLAREESPQQTGEQTALPAAGRPLEECLGNFWAGGEGMDSFKLTMRLPGVSGALLKMLGAPAFIKDKKTFTELIEECYREVSRKALEAAYDLEDENEA